MSPKDRRRAIDNAKDHFTRAAAALTAWQGEPEVFALIEATRGLMELVRADPEERVRARAEAWLAEVRAR